MQRPSCAWLCRTLLTFGTLGIFLAAGPARADGPGDSDSTPLQRARQRQQLVDQRIEHEVRTAVLEAQRLYLRDPEQAVERLKQALATVKDDTDLSPKRRDQLVSMLKDRIRVLQLPPSREAPARSADDRNRPLSREEVKAYLRRQLEEQRAARDRAQAANTATDSQRRLATDDAARRIQDARDRLNANRRYQTDRAARQAGHDLDIQKAATPPAGDYVVDAEKAERNRKSPYRQLVKLTTKEKSIIKSLNSPVTVTFSDSHFKDVIEYLATLSDQNIILDPGAMEQNDVTYDSPVTLKVRELSLRSTLRKVLSQFNLTYIVKDEVIYVTSKEKAKKEMVTRVYPVGDLVRGVGPLADAGLGLRLGPLGQALDQTQMVQNAATLIEQVKSTVDPDSWGPGGGSVSFDAASMALVVKQSAEVHLMLGGSLGR
jgi:hypothetical protein